MASVVATAPRRTRPPMLDQEDVEDLDDAPDRIERDRESVLDQATAAVRAIGVMVGIVLWLLLPRVLPASALLPVPACGGAVPRLALRRSAVREGVRLTKARRNNPRSNAAHDRNRIDRLRHARPLSQTWAVAYLVRHFARENSPSRKPRWKVPLSTTSLPHEAIVVGHDPARGVSRFAFPLIQFRIPRCLRDFFGWLASRTTGLSRRERSKPRGKRTRLQSQIEQRRRSP